MLKYRFPEKTAFLHTFAVLCISVFNISDSMRCSVAVLQLQNSLSPYRKYANIINYIYIYIYII